MLHGRGSLLVAASLLGFCGCVENDSQSGASHQNAPARQNTNSAFDAERAGAIEGRVVWDGPVPDVPSFNFLPGPDVMPPNGTPPPNPMRPRVDPASKGVADVVVFLRGIDAAKARPWPHAPVSVELTRREMRVVQGEIVSRIGFIRRGDSFEAASREPTYHALRARGAAFFTLPFVDADRPSRRQLDHLGIVDLSSGSGLYWLHARLLVVDHPYYVRTDQDGRFRLDQVPAGRYEAVCWLPSWIVAHKDRDPESGLISRVIFAPPIEQSEMITVDAGRACEMQFSWNMGKAVAAH
jgi:hypothetical protein